MSDMTKIQVHEFPKCDFCGEPAPFDDKTTRGPWANMCKKHQRAYGFSIGSERELIVKKAPVKDFKEVPVVQLPLSMKSVLTAKCPWCGQKRRVEPDANYLVTCESCEKPYRLRSAI